MELKFKTALMVAVVGFSVNALAGHQGVRRNESVGEANRPGVVGDCVLLENIYQRETESGYLEIIPLETAMRDERCEKPIYYSDYSQIEAAYDKLMPCGELSDEELAMAAVGFSCKTSKGIYFSRIEGGWKDMGEGGMIWYDAIENVNPFQAKAVCESNAERRLPTGYPTHFNGNGDFPRRDSEFVTAVNHGIREVIRNMKNPWCLSVNSPSPASYIYHCRPAGDDGKIFAYRRTNSGLNGSAHCVRR